MSAFGLCLCAVTVGAVAPAPGAFAVSGQMARSVDDPPAPTVTKATWREYLTAITDAAVALPSEVDSDLLVPAPSDTRTR